MALSLIRIVANVMEDTLDDGDSHLNCTSLISTINELLQQSLAMNTEAACPKSNADVDQRHNLRLLGSQARSVQRACNYFVLSAERTLSVIHGSNASKEIITDLMHQTLASWLQSTDD